MPYIDTNTFYQQTGKGPNLLLIHGWGTDLSDFDTIIPYLSKKFTVTMIDLYGHGLSSIDNHLISTPNWLIEIDLIIDALQLSNPILIGHSLGGRVALRYTFTHSKKIKQVITLNTTYWGNFPSDYIERLNTLKLMLKKNKTNAIYHFLDSCHLQNIQSKTLLFKKIHGTPTEALLLSLDTVIKDDQEQETQLKKLVNTSITLTHLQSEMDQADQTQIDFLDNTPRPIDYAILPHCGHYSMLDNPELVARTITNAIY